MSPETTALLAAARRVHEEYIASAARLRAMLELSHHTIAECRRVRLRTDRLFLHQNAKMRRDRGGRRREHGPLTIAPFDRR